MRALAGDVEERNPFAPPEADLTAPDPGDARTEPERASPASRAICSVLGILIAAISTMGMIVGTIFFAVNSKRPWLAKSPWALLPAAAVVLVYAPVAVTRLVRTGQTVPMRILRHRYLRKDGGPPRAWRLGLRVVALPVLLVAGLIMAAALAASQHWIPDAAGVAVILASPFALSLDALGTCVSGRRSLLDRMSGLTVVKA